LDGIELPASAEQFMQPTRFFNSGHPSIVEYVDGLGLDGRGPEEKAAVLFGLVRDEINYEFEVKVSEELYVASTVLARAGGFCVQKASLFCALCRAAGIPAGIVLSDLKDHILHERKVKEIGTNVMYYHGLNALHIGGKWIYADASLTSDILDRRGCGIPEFDADKGCLIPEKSAGGEPNCEYVRFHGLFAELPFKRLLKGFREHYKHLSDDEVHKRFERENG